MKFEIKNRWNGSVIFTAEIEASEETPLGIKLGLAVKALLNTSADLRFANLRSADLSYANLRSADLSSANLRSADLSSADLSEANLSEANLRSANLSSANLSSANLSSADLSEANLRSADLSSANLRSADLSSANLRSADLSSADLSSADLSEANLRSANLSSANLRSANLSYANLRSADLSSANLRSADLSSAIGIKPELSTPLFMLLDQPGKIRAYKLVNSKGEGPFNGGITYEIGESYEVENASADASKSCGAGINVATLDWCLKEWREGYRILIIEFEAADIACIPTSTDGKFRLHRCSVVTEKSIDPVALGLVQAEEAAVEDTAGAAA